MNVHEIDSLENVLIKNVLATCWNFAEEVEDCTEYGCVIHDYLFNREINRRQKQAKALDVPKHKV